MKSTALAVAVQPAVPPRPSVTVTLPSWLETDCGLPLTPTVPRFTGPAGTLMSSVPDETWTVTGVSAAEAGVGDASTATAAPAIKGLMTLRILMGATSLGDLGSWGGTAGADAQRHARGSMINKRTDSIAWRLDRVWGRLTRS
ncbi:hypothetical protein [Streptomyces sp. OK228]|uniref:hypothetical protein n=1 Tax=Streptomyces sp. OK228 TaxID=1882786 RepID=UPI00117D6DC6|nr:hypothetical protein [Streptomyces sp. OK228]